MSLRRFNLLFGRLASIVDQVTPLNSFMLQDLLANDSINLDHVFKMSLIEDIIRVSFQHICQHKTVQIDKV